jgi:hypothetical protein
VTVEHLPRWVSAGLISQAQAEEITRFERDLEREAAPPGRSRTRASVAEVLGSLGAIAASVAAVVGTVTMWGELTSPARVAIPVIGALVLLAAGAVVPRDESSLERLGAFLWLLGIAASGGAVAIVCVDVLGWSSPVTAVVAGAVVVALSLLLSTRCREPHLVVALGGGLTTLTVGLMAQYTYATGGQFGALLIAAGLGLMLFAWAERLVSTSAGYIVGGAIAFVGTQLLGDIAEHWPIVVGLVLGAGFLAAYVGLRQRALLVVGLLFTVVFLIQGIVRAADERPGGGGGGGQVIVLSFAVGVALVATALVVTRRSHGPAR